MAQQYNPAAAAVITDDRTHFLVQKRDGGFLSTGATLGLKESENLVLVWQEGGITTHPVVHNIGGSGFSYQNYLTPAEARTLAQALTMAADLADEQKALATRTPSAEVAA